jgi:hypothetical protein
MRHEGKAPSVRQKPKIGPGLFRRTIFTGVTVVIVGRRAPVPMSPLSTAKRALQFEARVSSEMTGFPFERKHWCLVRRRAMSA